MNLLDGLVLVLLVAAAVGGYRMGFVTRVLSWVGLLLGLVVAVRLLPGIITRMGNVDEFTVVLIAIVAVFAGTFIGQAIGLAIGARLRPADREHGGVTRLDGAAGAAAGMVGLLAVLWLLIPVMGSATGWMAREATGSSIARALDSGLPDPPDAMQTLRVFVGEGAFPEVFEGLRETPDVGPPPEGTGLSQEVTDRVAASVVLVEGNGCERIQNGSGFVVGEGLVLTNAHVVAGQDSIEVRRSDGAELVAELVSFDPRRDLAVLSVPEIDRPALALAGTSTGASAGVFGHPGGEPLRIAPARVAAELAAVGRDIYGGAGAQRQVLELAAELRPGDSGAPVVDASGAVVGVVFAVATDRGDVAYALTTGEVEAALATGRSAGTSSGACVG